MALPARTLPFVSFREDVPAELLLAAPIGEVTVRERIAPLGERITKAGNAEPPSPVMFDVTAAAEGFAVRPQTEPFAMSSFQRRPYAERLTGRAFEPAKAGVTISGDAIRVAPPISRDVTFEEVVVDDVGRRRNVRSARLSRGRARAGVAVSAAMLSPTGMERRRFGAELPDTGVAKAAEGWQVVSTENLQAVSATPGLRGVTSHATARARLEAHLAKHPGDAGRYQVVRASEALAG